MTRRQCLILIICAIGTLQAAPNGDNTQDASAPKRHLPLPALLGGPSDALPHQSRNNHQNTSGTPEGAKQKFTTLVIAPNETTACFLPDVYSFERQGKTFLLESGALGLALGLFIKFGADGIGNASTQSKNNFLLYLISSLAGTAIGGLTTLVNYGRLKRNYRKNENLNVMNFFQKKWKQLYHNKNLVWAQHVVGILNYLQEKYDNGTFDLEEAKLCISALQERGRVT